MSVAENRFHPRCDSAHGTSCTSQGRVFEVEICNLSEGGALIEGEDLALEHGARTELRLEALGSFAGVVKWIGDRRAGIAFDKPLHAAVVLFMAKRTKLEPGDDATPRDRFGRALPTPPFPSRFVDILSR